MKSKSFAALAAIVLAGTASTALAQGTGTTGTDPYATDTQREDDNDFPWGLLGLLGLAGLLGRKRDRDDDTRRTNTGTTNRP